MTPDTHNTVQHGNICTLAADTVSQNGRFVTLKTKRKMVKSQVELLTMILTLQFLQQACTQATISRSNTAHSGTTTPQRVTTYFPARVHTQHDKAIAALVVGFSFILIVCARERFKAYIQYVLGYVGGLLTIQQPGGSCRMLQTHKALQTDTQPLSQQPCTWLNPYMHPTFVPDPHVIRCSVACCCNPWLA